jgi:hypothetical protein
MSMRPYHLWCVLVLLVGPACLPVVRKGLTARAVFQPKIKPNWSKLRAIFNLQSPQTPFASMTYFCRLRGGFMDSTVVGGLEPDPPHR